MVERRRPQRARRRRAAKSRWGRTTCASGSRIRPTSRASPRFSLLVGHRRVWVNSLGAEWLNEIELGRIVRAATEFYQPLDIDAIGVRVGARLAAERAALRLRRLAARRRIRGARPTTRASTSACPLGNSGEIRIGPTYTYYKGRPTVAVPGFQSTRQTDAGVRVLGALGQPRQRVLPAPRRARPTSTCSTASARSGWARTPTRSATGWGAAISSPTPASGSAPTDFVNVAAHAGALSRDDPSLVNPFLLGGFLNLSGLRNGELAGSYLGLGRVVYYYRIARVPYIGGSVFAGGSLEAGNAWQQRDAVIVRATWSRPAASFWPPTPSSARSTSRTDARPAARRASTCSWAARRDQRRLARAQPQRRVASVHADEGARDAAAGADRARAGRMAVRLRRPPLPRRREFVVGEPLRPRESAHQRGARGAARRTRARDPRRLHAPPGGRTVGAARRRGARRAGARVLRLRRRVGGRDRAQDGVPLLARTADGRRRPAS